MVYQKFSKERDINSLCFLKGEEGVSVLKIYVVVFFGEWLMSEVPRIP